MQPLNPMVPLLAGYLYASADLRGQDVMKVVASAAHLDGFEVTFASGLKVRVKIEVVHDPEGSAPP